MKEFEVVSEAEYIEFKIGKDIFKAVAADRLPGNILMRYAEQTSAGKLYEAHQMFFSRCLEKESAELFNHRLDSQENPIPLNVMAQVAEWLIEQYSSFPTAPAKR